MGFFENFAFFNALFMTMENQGYSSSDLGDKNILIIHHGRNCCYWPGNAKILCPKNGIQIKLFSTIIIVCILYRFTIRFKIIAQNIAATIESIQTPVH